MQTITLKPGESVTITAAPADPAPSKLYFSYYGGMDNEIFPYENMVWGTTWGHPNSEWIVDALTRAASFGVKAAMVSIDYLVYSNTMTQGPKHFLGAPVVTANLHTFFDLLRAAGVLGMVKALYPIDEPDLFNVPASDIAAANSTIRGVAATYPELAGVALAVIYSNTRTYTGILSYDWVGMDDYDQAAYVLISRYPEMIERMKPDQKLIVVPGGADPWETPVEPFYEYAQQNPRTVLIAPFIWQDQWGGTQNLGIKSNGMAASYNAVASLIRGA